ncbi:hypothetical protein JQC72_13305 [Polycladomyces sp. WAk]|uniref:Uncharacterized protein n=1 Tax=Polycladomyces zharkentensis TaxID=2807616 RepID=A0ABS2WLX5_9BACL|nr:hypothetical protein [Polycladomyces sp. WAk]MBN2910478.1 hypothetical protein [Polycladomyces sp. WAk]
MSDLRAVQLQAQREPPFNKTDSAGFALGRVWQFRKGTRLSKVSDDPGRASIRGNAGNPITGDFLYTKHMEPLSRVPRSFAGAVGERKRKYDADDMDQPCQGCAVGTGNGLLMEFCPQS